MYVQQAEVSLTQVGESDRVTNDQSLLSQLCDIFLNMAQTVRCKTKLVVGIFICFFSEHCHFCQMFAFSCMYVCTCAFDPAMILSCSYSFQHYLQRMKFYPQYLRHWTANMPSTISAVSVLARQVQDQYGFHMSLSKILPL